MGLPQEYQKNSSLNYIVKTLKYKLSMKSKAVKFPGGHYSIELSRKLSFTEWLFIHNKIKRKFDLEDIGFFDFNEIDLVDDCIPFKSYINRNDLINYEGFITPNLENTKIRSKKDLTKIIQDVLGSFELEIKKITFDFDEWN